jgi:hypothetical protein
LSPAGQAGFFSFAGKYLKECPRWALAAEFQRCDCFAGIHRATDIGAPSMRQWPQYSLSENLYIFQSLTDSRPQLVQL